MGEGKKKDPLVFIKDSTYGWIPAQVQSQSGDKAVVKVFNYRDEQSITCDGGANASGADEETINLKDYAHGVLPLQNVNGSNRLVAYPDMVKLPYLHEVRTLLCLLLCLLSFEKKTLLWSGTMSDAKIRLVVALTHIFLVSFFLFHNNNNRLVFCTT